jgi:hypothetical protein
MFTESYIQESHYMSSCDSDSDSFRRCVSSDQGSDGSGDEGLTEDDLLSFGQSCSQSTTIDSTTLKQSTCTSTGNTNINTNKVGNAREEGISRLYNDYEIGHVRSAHDEEDEKTPRKHVDHEADEENMSQSKAEDCTATSRASAAAENERKELFDREVEGHKLNTKYKEYKRAMGKTKQGGMGSSRNLWFDEMNS